MTLIKAIQSGILFIPLLISISSFAGNSNKNYIVAGAQSGKIDNDGKVCGAVERGNIDDLEAALRERFNLSLEEGYLNVFCGDTDLMGTVIESPHERYALIKNIMRHFTRAGEPEMFSKLLLTKIDGREALKRIDISIKSIERRSELRGTEMHTRLLKMQKTYTAWLIKHPVATK